MYDNTIHRDYVKTELEYRLGRDPVRPRRPPPAPVAHPAWSTPGDERRSATAR